jgi:hypothetical protein
VAENILKKLCKCASCGNESEMTITCSLDFGETPTSAKEPDVKAPSRMQAHAVCSHCGNEADIWMNN